MLAETPQPRVKAVPGAPGDLQHAEDAAFLAAAYGLAPYDWQRWVLEAWLAVGVDGRLLAGRCGLAVPRQNGKNVAIEIVELYKMIVQGRRILHSAHQVKTAEEHFYDIVSFFENPRYPELAAMAKIRRTNGKESIHLANGGSLQLVARSKSAGRGYTADDLVLDEAQELTENALGALLPTLSAAPSGDPQVIYTGTPPGPDNDGAAWTRVRDAALAGTDQRLAYLEWSLTGDVDLDDQLGWYAANPSLGGGRLLHQVVADERAAMDPETFQRERLGMWASEVVLSVIAPTAWAACYTPSPPTRGPKAYAVDMSPDRRVATIGAARLDETTGAVHVEVAAHDSTEHGTGWVLAWLTDPARLGTARAVVIDSMSPAAALVVPLQDAGVEVTMTGPADMARACGQFYDRVGAHLLSHYDQPSLNRAVSIARRRAIGSEGGWGWNKKAPGGDITPLVACTLAAHGLVGRKAPKPKTGRAVFA